MQKSVTYTVLITRHPKGFVGSCPALTDCVVLGGSRAGTYKAVKSRIRRRLIRFLEEQRPVPTDSVVAVKHLRLNLVELAREVSLR